MLQFNDNHRPNYFVLPNLIAQKLNRIAFLERTKEDQRKLIFDETLKYFGVKLEDVLKPCRKKNIVRPRHVICYLLKVHTRYTLVEIADIFDQDHTTVVNARNTVIDLMSTNDSMKDEIKQIEESLNL